MKKQVMIFFNVLFYFFACSQMSCAGEALLLNTYVNSKKQLASIEIKLAGIIDIKMYEQFKAIIEEKNKVGLKISSTEVIISSGGGDVRVAMQLGRELRRLEAHIQSGHLSSPGICASACILIASGASRSNDFSCRNSSAILR